MIKCQVDTRFAAGGPAVRKESPSPLIDFRVNRLSAAIHDLSQLANFGSEVFERLVNDSMNIFERVDKLSGRITACEQKQKQTQARCQQILTGFTWTTEKDNWRSKPQTSADFFNADSKDRSLHLLYEAADSAPELSKIDPFRDDGKESLKIYTNPQFFIETWAAKRAQEDKERKADRKKKRIKLNKNDIHTDGKKTVRTVKIKKYNEAGELIVEPSLQMARKTSMKSMKSEGKPGLQKQSSVSNVMTRQTSGTTRRLPTGAPGTRRMPVDQSMPPPMDELPAIPTEMPPPPPASKPPPPPALPSNSPPPPPPLAGAGGAGPALQRKASMHAVAASHSSPPPPPTGPPPPPAPPPCAPPPPSGGDTLEVVKPTFGAGMSSVGPSLLEQIQRGKELRKTETVQKKEQPAPENSSVAAILARRIAIEMSDSEDDASGDDSDDDEWDD